MRHVVVSALTLVLVMGVGCGGGGSEPETPAGQPSRACPSDGTIDTFAKGKLLELVEERLKEWHFQSYPDCMRLRAVASQIQRSDAQSSDEVWVVESCGGKCFEYVVRIRPVGQRHNVQVLNADDPTAR